VFHFTTCPESCPSDAPATISFGGQNSFTLTDSSGSGTYIRQ
jgi:hypothetical protein